MRDYVIHGSDSFKQVDDDARDIEDIQSIVTIVVCSVGLVFNILNIIITARTPVKGSLSIYLISLSVIDALFLLTVLPTRAFRCGEECVDRPLAVSFSFPILLTDSCFHLVIPRYHKYFTLAGVNQRLVLTLENCLPIIL